MAEYFQMCFLAVCLPKRCYHLRWTISSLTKGIERGLTLITVKCILYFIYGFPTCLPSLPRQVGTECVYTQWCTEGTSRPGNFTCFLLAADPFTKLQCSEDLSGNLPKFSSAHLRPCITSFLYPQTIIKHRFSMKCLLNTPFSLVYVLALGKCIIL